MPSFTEVPRNSLVASLGVADAVHRLGGTAHNDEVTKLLQRKSGGAWRYLVSSAAQHGLITYSNWLFKLTPLYTSILSSENAAEERTWLQKAFFFPDIYKRIMSVVETSGFDIETYLIEKEEFDTGSAVIIARNFAEGAKYVCVLPTVSGSSNPLFVDTLNSISLIEDTESKRPEVTDTVIADQTQGIMDSQNLAETSPTPLPIPPPPMSQIPTLLPPPPPPPPVRTPTSSRTVEKRVIQIPLPNNRVAELTIPSDLSMKDMTIIAMQMEVLKAYADNN